jgi:hypothetical protein
MNTQTVATTASNNAVTREVIWPGTGERFLARFPQPARAESVDYTDTQVMKGTPPVGLRIKPGVTGLDPELEALLQQEANEPCEID